MGKKLLVVVGVVVAVILVLMGVASMQPGAYHVERSVTVAAPADRIYPLLVDFRKFSDWSPWDKIDPNMTRTFEGPESGVGASYSWKGNDQVGEGKMTITEAVPDQKVGVKLEFLRPFPATSQVAWLIKADGGQSTVIWTMDGSNDTMIAKTFAMLMPMDKMIGKDFETGLTQLKALAEKP